VPDFDGDATVACFSSGTMNGDSMKIGGSKYSLGERIEGRYRRMSARWRSRRVIAFRSEQPLISFTFDDFPRSALLVGGSILNSYQAAGTYYVAMGLMGKETPTGTMFVKEDLEALLRDGHELGCHTFDHCHPWDTSPEQFEASLIANQRALTALFPQAIFHSMSYPFSVPTPRNKSIAGRMFDCCRGRGDFSNAGTADLNFLSSHFLERKLGGPEAALQAIEKNRKECGWLIFSTHDLSADPTPFGWTPEHFEAVVRAAVNSGARILPVVETWKRLFPSCTQHEDHKLHV
jgi:peptidoglycan/xylan/chitin deacetylase (PgdA/CDA1 family)